MKLSLIDRSTFEKIQQQNSGVGNASAGRKIRNAKYKKTRKSTYNLLHFLTLRPTAVPTTRERARSTRLRKPLKKRGKVREGGKRKKFSRLKKSILRYRQQKIKLNQLAETTLSETVKQLKALSLTQQCDDTITNVKEENSNALQTPIIHSRRFRTYCDNCTTLTLGALTEQLLRELDRFQKRAYVQNEIKAKAHRRFVVGFREMQSFLRINKVKLAIIAPDCEESHGESGLDETIANIKLQCQSLQIPYAFALRRRQLAHALYKKVPISCVAILDYDGARELFARLLGELQEARQAYSNLMETK